MFPFLLHKMLRKKKKKKKWRRECGCAKSDIDNHVKNKVTDELCPFPTFCLYVFD